MNPSEAGYVFKGSTPFIEAAAEGERVNPTEVQRFAPFSRLTHLLSQAAAAATKEDSQAILDAASSELPTIRAALVAAVDCITDVALGLGLDDRFGPPAETPEAPPAPGKKKRGAP